MSRLENLNKSPSSGERGGKRGERTLNAVFLAVRKAVRHILSVHVFWLDKKRSLSLWSRFIINIQTDKIGNTLKKIKVGLLMATVGAQAGCCLETGHFLELFYPIFNLWEMAFKEQDSCGSYELYSFIPLSIPLFMDFLNLRSHSIVQVFWVLLRNPGSPPNSCCSRLSPSTF